MLQSLFPVRRHRLRRELRSSFPPSLSSFLVHRATMRHFPALPSSYSKTITTRRSCESPAPACNLRLRNRIQRAASDKAIGRVGINTVFFHSYPSLVHRPARSSLYNTSAVAVAALPAPTRHFPRSRLSPFPQERASLLLFPWTAATMSTISLPTTSDTSVNPWTYAHDVLRSELYPNPTRGFKGRVVAVVCIIVYSFVVAGLLLFLHDRHTRRTKKGVGMWVYRIVRTDTG